MEEYEKNKVLGQKRGAAALENMSCSAQQQPGQKSGAAAPRNHLGQKPGAAAPSNFRQKTGAAARRRRNQLGNLIFYGLWTILKGPEPYSLKEGLTYHDN